MRRIIVVVLATALVGLVSGAASASKPSYGCPNPESGHVLVDRAGWLEWTVAGFAVEGYDTPEKLDEISVTFGFANWGEFAAWIVGPQWERFNKNGNDYVCIKKLPHTPGIPGYIFNGIDDQSSSGR